LSPQALWEEDSKIAPGGATEMTLINMLHLGTSGFLAELAEYLVRLEDMSHILVWTKSNVTSPKAAVSVDLIELPRLQLSFYSKSTEEQLSSSTSSPVQLFCTQYVGMYISNVRTERINSLISGIHQAIILQNNSGELGMVVPALTPTYVHFTNPGRAPRLVFYHSKQVPTYIYPIHISKAFLFTPTIESAIYLLLMRMLHSQYHEAFQLVEACMSDSSITGGCQLLEFASKSTH